MSGRLEASEEFWTRLRAGATGAGGVTCGGGVALDRRVKNAERPSCGARQYPTRCGTALTTST
jgi:hypothetical protein